MIKVALRGLAGRKLRAVLTGIAIVLGVAMISGTYILTDTVQSAFTNLFTDSYAGTDAVVTGTRPRHLDRRREATGSADRRVAARRRARRRRGRARDRERGRRGDHDDPRRGRRGDRERGLADARLRHRHRSGLRPVQSAHPPRGALAAGRRRGGPRRRNRGRAGLGRRRHGRDLHAAAEARVHARRRRAVRRPPEPRRPQLHRVHAPGRAGAPRPRGPVRRDLCRRARGGHRGRSRLGDRAGPARRTRRS